MSILFEKLREVAESGSYRGHMPGHKGKPVLPVAVEQIDFTELETTGNLYAPLEFGDAILASEQSMARIFGVSDCVYCAGGSTLLIQAALESVADSVGRPPRILAARDAHRSFFSAMALLGGTVDFLETECGEDGFAVGIRDVDALREAVRSGGYDAVYLTAPNYYGSLGSLREVSAICGDAKMPLIVDAAHAAHLVCAGEFVELPQNSVAIFSAHKTLEALGGAAFALGNGEPFALERMLRGMQLFGSSSPSFAVLASLDLALSRALSSDGRGKITLVGDRVDALRERLRSVDGVLLPSYRRGEGEVERDRCRLVVGFDRLRGDDAAAWLESDSNVVCEMSDERWVVFIITAADSEDDLDRLERAIRLLAAKLDRSGKPLTQLDPPPIPRAETSLRDAYFAPHEQVSLGSAEGRIAAEILAPYPPGVPVVAPGEKISAEAIAFLLGKGYNVDEKVRVVRS